MSVASVGTSAARIEQRILAPLARLRRVCRLYITLEGLVGLGVAMLGACTVQLLLDRWLKLAVDQRALLNLLITTFWLWIAYRRLLLPLLRPIADDTLAGIVDRANPKLEDRIATAVQFAAGRVGSPENNSPQLVRAVIGDACQVAEPASFFDVLNHRRALTRASELTGLVLVVWMSFGLLPDLMNTWFRRNWMVMDVPWPKQTYIRPEGFDSSGRRRMPRGDELDLVARLKGPTPRTATLIWWTPSGREGRETMAIVGDTRLEVSLGTLVEDVHFRIVGGDERTREYVVQTGERPRILRTVTRITPPEYTGHPAHEEEGTTSFELLKGSIVELEVWANKPLADAQFIGPSGAVGQCAFFSEDRFRLRLETAQAARPGAEESPATALSSGVYHFALLDHEDWENRRPVRFALKVVNDRPPKVRLELNGVGEYITPLAQLPLQLHFVDEYGLGAIDLFVQTGAQPARGVPLEGFKPAPREFQTQTTLAIEPFGVQPEDRLRLWAEAADLDPRGPNLGRCEPVELRVLSTEDFLAQMARRELELRREFERLLSAQRGLKDALDRIVPELQAGRAAPAAIGQRLAGLARRQDAQARRTLAIGREFEQLLAEMQTNRVSRAVEERRIHERVIAPLDALARRAMPAASAAVDEVRREATPPRRVAVRNGQSEVVRQMLAILANMLEWEGYREAVKLLREIIAEQGELRSETTQALEQRLEDILGPDAPSEEPGSNPPNHSP